MESLRAVTLMKRNMLLLFGAGRRQNRAIAAVTVVMGITPAAALAWIAGKACVSTTQDMGAMGAGQSEWKEKKNTAHTARTEMDSVDAHATVINAMKEIK